MAFNLDKVPLLGNILGNSPQMNVVGLDPQSQGMIHDAAQRAINQTPDDIAKQNAQGIDAGVKALGQSDEQTNQEAQRTGQDPHMMQAVMNKYRNITRDDLKRFSTQNDIQSKLQKSQRMADVSQAAMAQQQVQTQNFAMLAQAYQQNEMARAQVVSSFIDLGGNAALINKFPQGGTKRIAGAMNAFNSGNEFNSPFNVNSGEMGT